ncbi:MAG TPA: hypothetical protein DD435_09785 [Cyanobacteria bacterium UBA8530]|nr:hypothetical protein [Cyanobacteria bacterium UBA8530]
MKKKFILGLTVGLLGIVSYSAQGKTPAPSILQSPMKKAEEGVGMKALRKAALEKKHLFLFIYEKDDAETRALKKSFEAVMAKMADSSNWVGIDKKAEKKLLEKYRLTTAPTPFVLVVAPNGAVTGGIKDLSESRIRQSIASPGLQVCLKALQARKFVLLCIQGPSNRMNQAALRGARDFKDDPQFSHFTEIVFLDPSAPSEASFLKKLGIAPDSEETNTVFLAPPDSILAKMTGKTSKEDFVDALSKFSANYGPGGSTLRK